MGLEEMVELGLKEACTSENLTVAATLVRWKQPHEGGITSLNEDMNPWASKRQASIAAR